MKRMHVHVSVPDLQKSIKFYSTLFASQPTVEKPDYAKWMLEDPRVNFAISERTDTSGIQHLGIQVENAAELSEVYDRLSRADSPVIEEKATTCCYAKSDKQWINDPQGIAWETFLTHGEATVYGNERPAAAAGAAMPIKEAANCCEPRPAAKQGGCCPA